MGNVLGVAADPPLPGTPLVADTSGILPELYIWAAESRPALWFPFVLWFTSGREGDVGWSGKLPQPGSLDGGCAGGATPYDGTGVNEPVSGMAA